MRRLFSWLRRVTKAETLPRLVYYALTVYIFAIIALLTLVAMYVLKL